MRSKLHNFLSFSLPVFLCIDRHTHTHVHPYAHVHTYTHTYYTHTHTHWEAQLCGLLFKAEDAAVKGEPFASSISIRSSTTVCKQTALFSCRSPRLGPRRCPAGGLTAVCWKCQPGLRKKRHGRDSSPKNFDLRHKRFKQFTSTAPSNIAMRNNSERVLDSPWRSPTAEPRCGWWLSTWLGSSRVFSMTEPAWSARSNSSRSSLRRPRSSALLAAQTSWYVSNPSGFAGCWSWMAILRVSWVVK